MTVGDKEQLIDGKYDHPLVRIEKTGGERMKIKFNMGQINCVNKIDMYFETDSSDEVSLTFTCTSDDWEDCECGGKQSERWCKEFKIFTVSTEGILPDDIPDKTDCIYGDTAKLSTMSTTPMMNFVEIVLTGYQPQGKHVQDPWPCISANPTISFFSA